MSRLDVALLDLAMACKRAGIGLGALRREPIRRASLALFRAARDLADDGAPDPDCWIDAYLDSGGNWRDLVAAVNRHALDASTRRKETMTCDDC